MARFSGPDRLALEREIADAREKETRDALRRLRNPDPTKTLIVGYKPYLMNCTFEGKSGARARLGMGSRGGTLADMCPLTHVKVWK